MRQSKCRALPLGDTPRRGLGASATHLYHLLTQHQYICSLALSNKGSGVKDNMSLPLLSASRLLTRGILAFKVKRTRTINSLINVAPGTRTLKAISRLTGFQDQLFVQPVELQNQDTYNYWNRTNLKSFTDFIFTLKFKKFAVCVFNAPGGSRTRMT